MLSLNWIKSTKNVWLPLDFNLASVTPTTGVYVIWHGGTAPWTVRVGQGDIASRLGAHRNDSVILAHAAKGGLFVTWATVQATYLDGVERFLADSLNPLVGDRHPAVLPVPVKLPWAA
jgi:hypothetical protein